MAKKSLNSNKTFGKKKLAQSPAEAIPDKTTNNTTNKKQGETRNGDLFYGVEMKLLRKLFDESNLGVALVNSNNQIVDCNRILKKMLGFSLKELKALTTKDITHPDDYAFEETLYLKTVVLSQHKSYRLEKRFLRKNGTYFWASVTSSMIKRSAGQEQYGIGIIEDISERKATNERLLESEERFRLVSEMVSDYAYAYQIDERGTICREWITDAASRITGYSLKDLLDSDNWTKLVHPDDIELSKIKLEETLENKPVEYEVRLITKNGDVRWVRDHTFPIWSNLENRVTHLYGAVRDITDQKLSELKLQESQEFVQQILDTSPNLIYIQSAKHGGNVFMNQASINFYGVSSEEIQKKGGAFFIEKIHPDDLHIFHNYIEFWKTAEDGAIWESDFRIMNSKNEWRWLRTRDTIFKRDDDGTVDLILGNAMDITERKEAREKLEQSEERFRNLFEFAPVGVAIVEYGGKFIEVNPALCQLLGYSRAELLHMSIKTVSLAEDVVKITTAYERLINCQSNFIVLNNRFITKDGKEVIGELYLQTITTPVGNSQRFVFQVIDITAYQVVQKKIAESERRFRLLIQNSSDITSILNTRGVILYISQSSEKVMGYLPSDVIGKNAFSNVHREDKARVRAAFLLAIQEMTEVRLECRYRHKNREWKYVEVMLTPQLNEPTIEGVIINIRDVSERKQVEQQLLQSQKMEAIGTLAGGMAHDFNNIMASILVAAQLIKDKPQHERIISRVDMIERAVKRGKGIVEQLLFFAREKQPEMKPIECHSIIQQIVQMVKLSFPKNIVVEVSSAADGSILGDSDQIYQVILNLAINARDAMPEGGTLTFSTMKQVDPFTHQPQMLIVVADTGTGITEEVQKRMFEPFFTTKEVGKGTGLGLSIVHGVIKAHKGKIEVQSKLGVGTTFVLSFPMLVHP